MLAPGQPAPSLSYKLLFPGSPGCALAIGWPRQQRKRKRTFTSLVKVNQKSPSFCSSLFENERAEKGLLLLSGLSPPRVHHQGAGFKTDANKNPSFLRPHV